MECMAQEPVLFEDVLCQIVDMIGPEVSLGFQQDSSLSFTYCFQYDYAFPNVIGSNS